MSSPRIYVACLAAYNNGKLHGAWIDATDADDMEEATKAMLAASPEVGAEEWAIHDYEGFEGAKLGESESFETVAEIAKLIEEHGRLAVELKASGSVCDWDEVADYISDNYQGAWSDLAAWAENFLEDTGQLAGVPDSLRRYIDFEAYARDARLGGDVFEIEIDGETHVFTNA